MNSRTLGRTGIEVSAVGFGAGPVSGLMTGADEAAQREVVARALEAGVNWFDTAPGYGQGQSEASVGRVLHELGAVERVHIATKVRLEPADLAGVEQAVRRSLEASFARLGVRRVTLLQLHNGITASRGAIPASLTPEDVLRPGGVREAFERVRADGLVRFVGLTGTGEPAALGAVIGSGAFDTIQVPHHLLSPMDPSLAQPCQECGLGVFAIRVLAGGAILGQPPSAHTLRTPYFPLAVYEDERGRAANLASRLGPRMSLKELAVRFALCPPIHSILVGFATPQQVDEVAELADRGPLPPDLLEHLAALRTADTDQPAG